MDRFTISLEETLAKEFDRLLKARGYDNRSEAVRDLIRRELELNRIDTGDGADCIGSLSYVYNHHQRDLADRLTELQHQHHDLCVSTQHVHLDHEHCIETVVLRGPTTAVRHFADSIIAERGVHHGKMNLITVQVSSRAPHRRDQRPHLHFRPRN
jgi:CopG family nickel-responsive transcriptional regulator